MKEKEIFSTRFDDVIMAGSGYPSHRVISSSSLFPSLQRFLFISFPLTLSHPLHLSLSLSLPPSPSLPPSHPMFPVYRVPLYIKRVSPLDHEPDTDILLLPSPLRLRPPSTPPFSSSSSSPLALLPAVSFLEKVYI